MIQTNTVVKGKIIIVLSRSSGLHVRYMFIHIMVYDRNFQNNTSFLILFSQNTNQEKNQKENIFPCFLTDNKKHRQTILNKAVANSYNIFSVLKYIQIRNQTTASKRLGLFSDLTTKAWSSKPSTVRKRGAGGGHKTLNYFKIQDENG